MCREALDRAGARLETSFLEPLQCGGVKTMGIHRPGRLAAFPTGWWSNWTPGFARMASFHSRADGRRHGVTAIAEFAGRTLPAAKGGDVVLDIGAAAAGEVEPWKPSSR